jgi:hypothetical protein
MVHQNSQVFENGKYGRKIRTDRKSGTSTLFVPIKEAWMDGAHVWLEFPDDATASLSCFLTHPFNSWQPTNKALSLFCE